MSEFIRFSPLPNPIPLELVQVIGVVDPSQVRFAAHNCLVMAFSRGAVVLREMSWGPVTSWGYDNESSQELATIEHWRDESRTLQALADRRCVILTGGLSQVSDRPSLRLRINGRTDWSAIAAISSVPIEVGEWQLSEEVRCTPFTISNAQGHPQIGRRRPLALPVSLIRDWCSLASLPDLDSVARRSEPWTRIAVEASGG